MSLLLLLSPPTVAMDLQATVVVDDEVETTSSTSLPFL
jgi:hypothetical protein